MKAAVASLMNALVLIVFGLWAYYGSETPSRTALIPVGFGVVIAMLHPGVRKEDKVVAHVAVLLTLLVLIGLIMPLKGAVGRGDALAMARVVVMMLSTIAALFFFIKSFVDVRRARVAAAREV